MSETLSEIVFPIVAVIACMAFVGWMLSGGSRHKASKGARPTDDMSEIGTGAGLMGGEMEDAFVSRFALRRRTPKKRK